MKWIILLFLFLLLLAIITTRFRRQILGMIEIWHSVTGTKHQERIEKQVNSKDVPLVKCVSCDEWVVQTDAIDLKTGSYYCSRKCTQKTVV